METGLEFEPWAKAGDRLVMAEKLASEVMAAAKVAKFHKGRGGRLRGHGCSPTRWPISTPATASRCRCWPATTSPTTPATGFVHTAPGHGADDYAVWLAHGHREIPDTVDQDGGLLSDGAALRRPQGAGDRGAKKSGRFGPANGAVMDRLIEAGTLLARGRLEHSYPHSWRSKAPVIFRNTPQWFIRMDEPLDDPAHKGRTLRETALESIDATTFYPAAGRNRIRAMVESRPDWLISRQRAWGSPLAMFVCKETGQPLHDPEVNARIVSLIHAEGADAWFTRPMSDFPGRPRP